MAQFNYPYRPPQFSGINVPKSYYEVQTATDTIIRTWDIVLQDTQIIESWPMMDKEFFLELKGLFEANNGNNLYKYQVEEGGTTYVVEIVALEYQKYNDDYYQNTKMTLKPFKTI